MTIIKPSFTQKLRQEVLLEYPQEWIASPEAQAEWVAEAIAHIDLCRALLESPDTATTDTP
jgi:hypothetical protein